MRHAIVLLTITSSFGACGTPQPQLRIGLAEGPSQKCPSTDCTEVALACDAVMGIRIIDPKHPESPLLDQCEKISPNKFGNICSYKTIDLNAGDLPVRDLEVQVAVYPLSRVAYDESTKSYTCPPAVMYSAATDFPIEQAPTPALGGRGYYHPGDADVNVTLGCTDLAAINEDPTCVAEVGTQIIATVTDFGTRLPVVSGSQGASLLRVAVGEPRPFEGGYVLNPIDEIELQLREALTPSWTGETDTTFHKFVCLDVLQFGTEVTPVLQCTTVNPNAPSAQLNLSGVRLQKGELRKILNALDKAHITVPDAGLTIGIVLDATSRGAPDYQVMSNPTSSVTYLTDTEKFSGSKTTETGIFVSQDAPFGTVFSTMGGTRPTVTAVGGRVAGKVTVVVLPPVVAP